MANPLIVLPADATAVQTLESHLVGSDKIFLLIIGASSQHQLLRQKALPKAVDFRFVMEIADYELLKQKLGTMENGHLFNGITSNTLGVSISKQGVLCATVQSSFQTGDILLAFNAAETND